MKTELIEKLLNNMTSTGCNYADVFYEDTISKTYIFENNELDDISISKIKGVGLRCIDENSKVYISTNNLDEDNLIDLTNKLKSNFCKENDKEIKLVEKDIHINHKIEINHDDKDIELIKDLVKKINRIATDYSDLISKIKVMIYEYDQISKIAKSNGDLFNNTNTLTRFMVIIYATENNQTESCMYSTAGFKGYELLDGINWDKEIKDLCATAIEKLSAKDFKGGKYPVIIENGFGAILFHEACGHGLEADRVAPGLSIFKDDLGKRVGTSKVTLIDDGSIPNAWGSVNLDDEGNIPQKNILIEKGILKKYLVDYVNQDKLNQKVTGSGRRENYHYPPTSRMNNTYIENGTDSIEDMIKSISYGVYCKSMAGGSVMPATGEFNFKMSEAYVIENGKLGHMIKGATLIGNSKDILKSVEMVSSNLELGFGRCGSDSGWVPVTVGQPTIKISNMLIGGKGD